MTTKVRTVIAVVVVVVGRTADADMIVNGSLSGPNHTFSLIPSGWANLFPDDPSSTPDTEGANGPHEPYNLSADGGTFVAGAHATLQPPLGIEGIQQTVTGLSVGLHYRLDFFQSNLGFGADNVGGAWGAFANWQLYLDGSPTGLFSDTMAAQTGTLPNNAWFASGIIFTASSDTHAIGFGPNSVSGQNAFLGIDGIRISPIVVPEPSGVFLLAIGTITPLLSRRMALLACGQEGRRAGRTH